MKLKKSTPADLSLNEQELLAALRGDPLLAEHLMMMVRDFQRETATGMDAYQVELHVVNATRKLGGLMVTRWAEQTEQSCNEASSSDTDMVRHGKKKLHWHSTFGRISISQQVFLSKSTGRTVRPFLDHAKLSSRGCSLLLRRRLVDFSSERSMNATVEALREHYGVELSASVVNKVTRQTGSEAKRFNADAPASKAGAALLVVELDGSMVPVVEYGDLDKQQKASGLKRNRNCFWKEFRLCTASRSEGAGHVTQ